MTESPLACFRGATIVMASDLGGRPHSHLMVQLCGDAHLRNVGFNRSPERQRLCSITDVDETHLGLYEWDVQRLVTSVVPTARSLGLNEKQHSKSARQTVHADGEVMEEFASMPQITMEVTRL